MQPLFFLRNGLYGKLYACNVIRYMLVEWQRLRDAKQFLCNVCASEQKWKWMSVSQCPIFMSVDLSDIEPELSLSLKNITKWLFYLLCVQKGTSFSHWLLNICYGMMMCSILIPSICGNEKGHVYVCVRSREGIESALLAVFGYDSMESGSDKRRPGVMSHIPCPCFLPSGLQMGREMPCSPVCLPPPPPHPPTRELNHSWVFHP